MTALLPLEGLDGRKPGTTTPALLDARARPLRDLRVSLTDHCNLRCAYCMPAHAVGAQPALPSQRLLDFEEIVTLSRLAAELGVRKVKLTGGEPLTRPSVPTLVRMLRAAVPNVEVNLITNGVLLAPLVTQLREAGLHRLTVSLDSLDPERFATLTGRTGQLDKVLEGIEAAKRAGFRPLKLNVVVMRGINDGEVERIAARFREPDVIVRFIEYMDVGTVNHWQRSEVVSASEILARLRKSAELIPVGPAYRGETAKRYRYADGSSEIGFIASVSQPFCGDCSRLRLSADGRLFTCLFANDGFDVKTVLRHSGEAAARQALIALWRGRRDQYSVERAGAPARAKAEMFYLGG